MSRAARGTSLSGGRARQYVQALKYSKVSGEIGMPAESGEDRNVSIRAGTR